MQRLILFILIVIVSHTAFPQNTVHPCSAPECSQFDFWLGNWDLTWSDTAKGTNSVKKILDGCVINENFSDPASHYMGMSWSMYDLKKAEWKQTWVDNQDGYIILTGKYSNQNNSADYYYHKEKYASPSFAYFSLICRSFHQQREASTLTPLQILGLMF